MMYRIAFVILSALVMAVMSFADNSFGQTACNYYASPSGTGNGLSQSSPFRVSNFWSVAAPGKTLCLLDGTYTDSDSMINPPQNLKGTSGSPITVRALNEGKVLINGQGVRGPIRLYINDWFVIDGINVCCSNQTVVHLASSNNNVVRRVAAWDAAEGNYVIFGIQGGHHNLLEDVAGWGTARKIYSSSQGGNFTIVRRAWGRWEGSHVVGPKSVYSLAYNNYDMIVENSIGTWSGEKMKSTYTLLDYYGKAWTGPGAGTYTGYSVDQPYGIFAIDGFNNGNPVARAKLLGSIAYVTANDRFQADQSIFVTQLDAFEISNTVAYVQPGSYSNVKPFLLAGLSAGANSLTAKNLTGIGGTSSHFDSQWQKSNVIGGSSTSIYNSGENIFNTTRGANVCYRYQNGIVTTQPLWPWPMNQRIIDAMSISGRVPVNVTATIEAMFGSIPAGCKGASTGGSGSASLPAPSKPSAPANLQVKP